MELHRLSIPELAELLATKELSARECVSYFCERIERINASLNSFVALDFERALRSAEQVDEKRAHNRRVGFLGGVPFGVKDLEDCEGFVTTRGSALFADSNPAKRSSYMVERFTEEGAIPLGKTNTPEFGWKSDTDNPIFGQTRNPYDTSRSPGGSSGGSASAVASGQVPFATGSDGGGSLRIPASVCGLTAMKTSLGRVPVVSEVPVGWADLAVAGPLAKTASDTAVLLDLVVAPHGRDFRSQSRKVEQWGQEILARPGSIKAAFSPDLGYASIDPEIAEVTAAALSKLEAQGVEISQLDSLFGKDPLDEFFTMTNSYYAKSIGPLRSHRRYKEVDPGIKDQVEKGLRTSAVEFLKASDLSFYMTQTLYKIFEKFDVLLSPTTAGLPPVIGGPQLIAGREVRDWVQLTYPFNMTRSPAATVFSGIAKSGIPVGLQIVGPHLGDLRVLRTARLFEEILGTSLPSMD